MPITVHRNRLPVDLTAPCLIDLLVNTSPKIENLELITIEKIYVKFEFMDAFFDIT